MPADASAATVVYLGIVVPAPDYPERHERVEKVFATREAADEWQREMPALGPNSTYRRVECKEVEA